MKSTAFFLSFLFCAVTLAGQPETTELQTCFSPVEKCDAKLEAFIYSAEQSLDIAVYSLTHVKIAQAIIKQSKRLPVRVVVDKVQSKGNGSMVDELVAAGVKVKYGHQKGVMHNKFTVVDRVRMETGSYNYTNNATDNNNENQLYLNDLSTVQIFTKRFEQIWKDGTPVPGLN